MRPRQNLCFNMGWQSCTRDCRPEKACICGQTRAGAGANKLTRTSPTSATLPPDFLLAQRAASALNPAAQSHRNTHANIFGQCHDEALQLQFHDKPRQASATILRCTSPLTPARDQSTERCGNRRSHRHYCSNACRRLLQHPSILQQKKG